MINICTRLSDDIELGPIPSKKKKKIGVFRYFSYIPNLTPGDRPIAVRWKNRSTSDNISWFRYTRIL